MSAPALWDGTQPGGIGGSGWTRTIWRRGIAATELADPNSFP